MPYVKRASTLLKDVVHFCVSVVDDYYSYWFTGQLFRMSYEKEMFVRTSDIVIVGFDVTNQKSLDVCDDMIKQIREIKPDVIMVAAGNKNDLKDQRQVTEEFARTHFAEMQPPIEYFDVSAKTGEGVDELFEAGIRMWVDANPTLKTEASVSEGSSTRTNVSESASTKTNGSDGWCSIM